MLPFVKQKSKRSLDRTATGRRKPFASSNRKHIGDDSELLYPGLLETRAMAQVAPNEALRVEEAITEMLADSPETSPNSSRQRDAPKRHHTRHQRSQATTDFRRQPPTEKSSGDLYEDIENYLEQSRPAPPPKDIAYQKPKPRRPPMPRKRSSQGRVDQASGRIQHSAAPPNAYRPLRGHGKSVGNRDPDSLPEVIKRFRESIMVSQQTSTEPTRNMNPQASGYHGDERDLEQWIDADELDVLDWYEVPVVYDPPPRTRAHEPRDRRQMVGWAL